MAFPTFILDPALNTLTWARRRHQSRRRVKLTVHRAELQGPFVSWGGPVVGISTDSYFITITNTSRDRDIVVTHVWVETDPAVHVHDPDLPVRLKYSAPWETSVPVDKIPADPAKVPLAGPVPRAVRAATAPARYGGQHKRLRASVAAQVAGGGVACVRCGGLIRVGEPWDLGHVDGSDSYAGPEHQACNRTTAARRKVVVPAGCVPYRDEAGVVVSWTSREW